MQPILKFIALFFFLVFIAFAALQYNDEDALLWIYVYLVPAYISLRAFKNKFNFELTLVVALAAILGAYYFFPFGHYEGVALKHGMKTMEIELARESLGLAIIFIGMIFHFAQMKLQRK